MALGIAGAPEDGVVTGVVGADVAETGPDEGMTKVGSCDGVVNDDRTVGILGSVDGTMSGVYDGRTTPGV
jgi:hypothetical protein